MEAGAGFVDVTWEHDGAAVTGFAIHRETVTTTTATVATPLAEVGATDRSYRDETVEAGIPYRYSVAAQGQGDRVSSSTPHSGAPVVADEPLFELFAYVGTSAGTTPNPVTAFALILRGPQPEVDTSVAIALTGPPAWGAEAFEWQWSADRSQLVGGRSYLPKEVVSGAYEVRATIDDTSVATTVLVDADLVLQKATGVTLIRSEVDQLALSWEPIPGAAIYYVTLYDDGRRYLYADSGTDTEITLTGFDLDLNPTHRYRVSVDAASVDVGPGVSGVGEPAPSQQRNLVAGDDLCFHPGDEEFNDCD